MTVRCDCDESVWLGSSQAWVDRTVVRIESKINLQKHTVQLLSVKPYPKNMKVGCKVVMGNCILSQLSQTQIDELKEAMLGHASD